MYGLEAGWVKLPEKFEAAGPSIDRIKILTFISNLMNKDLVVTSADFD